MNTAPAAVSTAPVASERELLQELVGLHARMLTHMPWIQAALAAGVALGIGRHVSGPLLASWAALTIAVETARALYANRVLRRMDRIEPYREHVRMVALAVLSGLCEGWISVLFFPTLPVAERAFLGIVLFVVPAAGTAVSMSSRTIVGCYATAVLAPAIVSWSTIYPHQAWGVVSLGVLFVGLMVLVAIQAERLLLRSLTIRHERDQVVRDLELRNTEVRAAMARAEEAALARARVLAAASHDLRQPLHALSIYSAILAARPTPQTLQEVGQNIDQIVRSLGSLLGGLLDLSRLSAGHYVEQRQQFSLAALLDGLCDEFDSPASARGLALRRMLQPVTLEADATAVARIVRNLLDNAIKYTDSGEVRVGCHAEGGDAIITIADTGRGIPLAEQERVFEEFYQIDNPGRDRSKGVGLGLAIVQRLGELIGARVSLASRPGSGTRFTLELPDALRATVHPHEQVAPEPAPFTTQRRIYVVDDEQDILKSMRTLLSLWGIEAHTAIGGPELRALFARQGVPDLLIADLRLGGGEHGARLAGDLQRSYGAFPVLILTGETSSEALREAKLADYPVLRKPIAAEQLREAILAALGESALQADS